MSIPNQFAQSCKFTLTILLIVGILFATFGPVRLPTVHAQTQFSPNSNSNDISQRYVIFLDGVNSSSTGDPQTPLNGDFNFIRGKLEQTGISKFVYFSYGAADHRYTAYCLGWGIDGCSSIMDLSDLFLPPVYEEADTHLPISYHSTTLDWLIGQIVKKDPNAKIDLVGFSLGGLLAAYWGSHEGITSPYRNHIHGIIAVESPLGGIPLAAQCIESLVNLICPFLVNNFGLQLLRELQLPDTLQGSIVNEIPEVADNFKFTSIQSTTDYIVNGLQIQVDFGIYGNQDALVGQGSQYWVSSQQTLHMDKELGGYGLTSSYIPLGDVNDWIATNHNEPLRHTQTAKWIVEALQDEILTPPESASLVSPSGGITDTNPTYRWNRVSDSTWYYLWVSDAFGTPIIQQWYESSAVCGNSTCSVTPSFTLSNGDYYWWIQTWNEGGLGPWSSGLGFTVQTITIPPPDAATLISPSGNTSENIPTYRWNQVSNATWYYLWVSDAFGTPIIQQWYESSAVCGGSTCSVTVPGTLANGDYYWWIQTWNEGGLGPWSSGLGFTVQTMPVPSAATLISPSGSITDRTPTYQWNKESAATWYYLWVNDASGLPVFQQWYDSSAVCGNSTCSVTPDRILSPGDYTWWIQTWNDGGYGPWSNARNFSLP